MTGFITSDGADYLMSVFAGIEDVAPEYWVALVTAPVGTSESGDELTEPDFGDYSRSSISSGPENWVVAYGALTNIMEIPFPIPGLDPWTGVVGWALCDSQSGGRVLYAGDAEPYDVAVGEQVVLPAGSVTLGIELESWREVT
jgi:hypothetical protein